jgi:protein-tyrosine phosphatase
VLIEEDGWMLSVEPLSDMVRAMKREKRIDLHCHLLPRVDDGPATIQESLQLARELHRIGFSGVCATPHNPWGGKLQDASGLEKERRLFGEHLLQEGISLQVFAGAEHHSSMVMDLAANQGILPYPRGDTFLLEFSLGGFPPRLDELLFRLQVKGLVPVIAHVERYPEVQKSLSALESLKKRGCYLLVNLGSVSKSKSREIHGCAWQALKEGLVDAASTDAHACQDIPPIEEGLKRVEDLLGEKKARQVLTTVPREIIGESKECRTD